MENLFYGRAGERLALSYLVKRGYKIINTNFYCRWGELDIVAYKHMLVFVEVKLRNSYKYGNAVESVNFYKRSNLLRSINYYLKKCNFFYPQWRLDLISIHKMGQKYHIEHYKNILAN